MLSFGTFFKIVASIVFGLFFQNIWKYIDLSGNVTAVADSGPLKLEVLDRWTLTVNILQILIAQISFHIKLCHIEARYSISLYATPLSIWPSGFRDIFFILFKKANVPGERSICTPGAWLGLRIEYTKNQALLHIKTISCGQKVCFKKFSPL